MKLAYSRFYKINKWHLKHNIVPCLSYSKKPSPYSHTVNYPKTDFPLSLDSVHQRELQIQKKCNFEGLYVWQAGLGRRKKFVMHDGPPYANGKVHVGHALNKILKDIINRYKLLQGHQVVYKPGWDCHGTPIEQKALASLDKDLHGMDALQIRKMASKFAEESSRGQMESFKSWAVMADWQNGCYYTYQPQYEEKQLEAFYRLYEKGLVFQQYMPIFWSPSSRTALAESEIEYVEDYESTQVFLKLPIVHFSFNPDANPGKTYALIWTTTPWTLPLNKAVCYAEGIRYVLLQESSGDSGDGSNGGVSGGDRYVVSEKFKSELERITKRPMQVLSVFEGSQLKDSTYVSTNGVLAPMLPGAHVTSDKGTGLVHTAPAHGVEDFQVALKHGLSLECLVDEDGRYMEGVGEDLQGKLVLSEANHLVLAKLGDRVLHQAAFKHSYPHDWRSKQPLLTRASKQWFVNTKRIKEAAITGIESIDSYPTSCHQAMKAQLQNRDYWCITRQRYWGVPLPVFYRRSDGQPLISRASIDHLKGLFRRHGSDCWWEMAVSELLPASVLEKSGVQPGEVYDKGTDILDIWFDSGVSWFCVLDEEGEEGSLDGKMDGLSDEKGEKRDRKMDGLSDEKKEKKMDGERGEIAMKKRVADVYVEGLDQYGGWFMSSLLTSTALQDTPPFKSLVVHGFALDEQGRKMSKSLGNVVDPQVVVKGDENSPGYGVDVLRMWVACCGLEPSVAIGDSVLQEAKQKVFRLRKSLRFLIGSLHDYQPMEQPITELHLTDQYMLHQLADLVQKTTESFEVFNISRVSRLLDHFNSNKLSAFYLHAVKDRLYCGDMKSRQSVQHTMHHLLYSLTKLTAPITPHLSEEVFSYHPLKQVSSSVFKTGDWLKTDWKNQSLASTYDSLQPIRQGLFQMLASDKPAEFDLEIFASEELGKALKLLHQATPSYTSALCELMGTADVSLSSSLPSPPSSSSPTTKSVQRDTSVSVADVEPPKTVLSCAEGVLKCWLRAVEEECKKEKKKI